MSAKLRSVTLCVPERWKSAARGSRSTRMFALQCPRLLAPRSPPLACVLPAFYFAQYTKIVQKKLRSSTAKPEPTEPPPVPLSLEQLDRIARNKRAALERLASAQTPPGFGESWKEGLSAEFGKPYFKQVRGIKLITQCVSPSLNYILTSPSLPQLMTFVAEERKCRTVYPPADQVFTWTQMCCMRDVSVTAH